jgi:hypothetical protein
MIKIFTVKKTAYFRGWGHKVHLGLTQNTDKEKRSTKPDVSLVDNTKSYINIIVVHTAENFEMAYQNKIQNYIQLINILYERGVLHGTDKPTKLSESAVFPGPWTSFKIFELERICLSHTTFQVLQV